MYTFLLICEELGIKKNRGKRGNQAFKISSVQAHLVIRLSDKEISSYL